MASGGPYIKGKRALFSVALFALIWPVWMLGVAYLIGKEINTSVIITSILGGVFGGVLWVFFMNKAIKRRIEKDAE